VESGLEELVEEELELRRGGVIGVGSSTCSLSSPTPPSDESVNIPENLLDNLFLMGDELEEEEDDELDLSPSSSPPSSCG